jgi:hypothetical protein
LNHKWLSTAALHGELSQKSMTKLTVEKSLTGKDDTANDVSWKNICFKIPEMSGNYFKFLGPQVDNERFFQYLECHIENIEESHVYPQLVGEWDLWFKALEKVNV